MRNVTAWLLAAAASASVAGSAGANDLVISGVIDGPLSGGVPKAIELYVVNDIPDLSEYGVGSANNGGGSDGEEFIFPMVAATAGQHIYVASDTTGFSDFFGFAPDYVDGAANINGDDAIELFFMGSVIDVFGDINVDGSGEPWEHLDGWAYRVSQTGPDGSTFVLENWTFSGPNALDGETTNSTAAVPFPIGTFFIGDDCDGNGESDSDEILADPSKDCNNDGILDLCQLTAETDCDDNLVLDECEIADDPGLDCNGDGILDTCQLDGNDCNENGQLDECDIAEMISDDLNMDGFPDECQVSGVVINEILADPEKLVGDTNGDGIISFTDDEFVEIYNNTGGDLDLSGWMLSDGVAVRHIFPDGTIIADQCVVVVFGGGCLGDASFSNITAQAASEGGLNLNNDEDTVMLIDTTGVPATIVNYSEIAGLNSSITRVPEITGEFDVHFFAWGTRFSPGTQGDGTAFLGCPDDPPLPDADGDGVSDAMDNCALPNPCQEDCNENGVGDVCDIDGGFPDCNENGILDICEEFEDCNANFVPDECDLAMGMADCNENGILDECEIFEPGVDCNGNFIPDTCDIEEDPTLDMNGNFIIDSCEVVAPVGVMINEIRIDQPGGDDDEYVEILGPPDTSLDGLRYIVIGDGAAGSGVIEVNLDLSGLTIPPDGLLVIAEDTFSLIPRRGGIVDFTTTFSFENGDNVTHLIAANVNALLELGSDIDAEDDGVIDAGTWWTDVLDVVGLKESDDGDLLYAESLGGVNIGPDDVFVPAHVYRCSPDGTWTIGGFDPFSIDPPSADTPGAENVACAAGDCPGDADGDLTVGLSDLLAVLSAWGTTDPDADVDDDGSVGLSDLLAVLSNWGTSCE